MKLSLGRKTDHRMLLVIKVQGHRVLPLSLSLKKKSVVLQGIVHTELNIYRK
jgi:hypothetical protein